MENGSAVYTHRRNKNIWIPTKLRCYFHQVASGWCINSCKTRHYVGICMKVNQCNGTQHATESPELEWHTIRNQRKVSRQIATNVTLPILPISRHVVLHVMSVSIIIKKINLTNLFQRTSGNRRCKIFFLNKYITCQVFAIIYWH